MVAWRAVAVMAMGACLVGCGSSNGSGPRASAQMPTDQQTAAGLLRSWESTHPGSRAGVIDAVLPARRLISVADLPVNEVQEGTVISILDERQRALVSGVVVARHGNDVHIRYEALPAGERDPRVGDLAVWFPGGQAVPPESVEPGATTQPTGSPATQPADQMPRENPPTNAPATQPADTGAPVTQPAGATGGTTTGTEPANAGGTSGNTGATGGTQPPADLNK